MRKPRVPTTVAERYEVAFEKQPEEGSYEPCSVELTVHWGDGGVFTKLSSKVRPHGYGMDLDGEAPHLLDAFNALLDIGALQYDPERKRLYAGTRSTE